jgi:hypothetical protein
MLNLQVCNNGVLLTQQISWTLPIIPVLIKKKNVSETGICLCPQVKSTMLGTTDWGNSVGFT